jgi:hypothetical protein
MLEFFAQPIPAGIALWLVLVAPMWITMWVPYRWERRKSAERLRQWAQEDAERQRHWDPQQQLRELERQIWDEKLSDAERERQREAEARVAEVRREARRRLALPDEEG